MEQIIFEKFRSIIYRESGIVLPPEKLPLLSSRIQKRLSALGLKSERDYLDIIELDVSGDELVNLIDVVSTNVTHFYREEAHFSTYREILTALATTGKKEIKIWCAAASSGEEPYTLAIEAEEALKATAAKYKILATDICTKVLKVAMQASYGIEPTEKIPSDLKRKYLHAVQLGGRNIMQINEELTRNLLFKKLNLVSFPYPLRGPLDIIFCRNVMIYFDKPTRERIVNEFWRLTAPGGYLFLSHSENLLGIDHQFTKILGSVYRKS